MGGEILFLAHRLPFPPDRGDRIRSSQLLRALARLAPVHVGCLAEPGDRAGEGELAALAASYFCPDRDKPLALAGLEAMLSGRPVSLAAFDHPGLRQWVAGVLATRPIAAIVVFSGQMGQYAPDSFTGRLVMDLCDVDSAKFEAYAAGARWPLGLAHAREARLLAQAEAALAERADHTLLVSREEAELLRVRAPRARDIRVVGNGIDADRFSPEAVVPADLTGGGPHIVFTGQMDYPPNVAAAIRMARGIMPEVLRFLPAAQFHVVGRSPVREVRALHGEAGTIVHGEVADVRPYLAAADMAVAPLAIARGVQNKVLEAMAMALPVIVSPGAASGIDGAAGTHFVIAESDAAFVARILRMATEPQAAHAMGRAARRFVAESMAWSAMLADLPALVGLAADGDARDAA